MPNYGKITSVITDDVYPLIANSLKTNSKKYKAMIAEFMNKSHDGLYDIAPYDNIRYTRKDKEDFFASLNIKESDIEAIMKNCFYWNKPYNPQVAKEPYAVCLLSALRFFLINKRQQEAELTSIYLAFTGKLYASCFGAIFPKAPPSRYRAVMDYVINNMVNEKFDIKRYGNVFGAIRSLCITWMNTYQDDIIQGPDDDKYGKILQQMKGRELSFLSNIGNLYYEAYQNKNYLNYESDNLIDGEEFRITDNDANTAARITAAAITYMANNTVNLAFCNEFSGDRNIRPLEIKDIMESIISNKENMPDLRRICNILICDFMRKNKGMHPSNIEFMNYSLKEQPNTNNSYIVELNTTLIRWLTENSANFRRRAKSRPSTAISYRKAVKYYICRVIHHVALREI